ncbi:MAG TPA: ATP-binding protein [Caulobacteraceae bacterium]|jgi:two-component system osmolarity sensor histidine kinase EnvZ
MRIRPRTARWFLPRFLKRRLPSTLYGRSMLIIVLPIAIMQMAVAWAFYEAHWRTVTSRLSEGLAGDIAWAVDSYKQDPSPASLTRIADRAERSLGLSIVLQQGQTTLPQRIHRNYFAVIDRSLDRALTDRLDDPVWFDTTHYQCCVDIRVKVKDGTLRILAPMERAYATQGLSFVLWMAVATLILTGVALAFIRNQVRAIERLAEAAEAFGRGADADFKPHGAREVRQAAYAFLDMKERLQRHIEQRTTLLASVSHDLRTPLTRLKLELALAEPTSRTEDMKRDLSDMEHMIDEYLAFARGQGGESVETVAVRGLIEEVSEGAKRAGAQVKVKIEPELSMHVRPNAFKRALSNLVMNAAVHGERVEVAARAAWDGGVEILVDDNGPGIPPDRYEEAFKPFNRLDEARNQNEKGVGLGLAIARDVARGHGGDITLEQSPLGGLRAVVRLPG